MPRSNVVLDELAASGRAHDAAEPEHRRRLLNLEPETAALLAMLIRVGGRTRVLEIGGRSWRWGTG